MSRGVLACALIGMVAGGAAGQPVLRAIWDPSRGGGRGKGISADGLHVAWDAEWGANAVANLWSHCGGGSSALGAVPGSMGDSHAIAIARDGRSIVGYARASDGIRHLAFRWSAAEGYIALNPLPFLYSAFAYGTSADGQMSVGISFLAPSSRATLWNGAGVPVDLGVLDSGTASAAYAVSDDGSTVVGASDETPSVSWIPRAFRWTSLTSMQELGSLPGDSTSIAWAISGDASVVVGDSGSNSSPMTPFRWSEGAGLTPLGMLPGAAGCIPMCVNQDGSVIAGFATTPTGMRAVVWFDQGAAVDLADYLATLGVGTDGWRLEVVSGLSASGTSMTGWGTFNGQQVAWVLTAPGLASQSPSIVSQPLGSSVPIGGTGGVSVETDSTVAQHRWLRNGAALSESARIVGTTTPALTIAGFQPSDQGVYTCVVTNPCGDTTSDGAELSCRASVGVQPVGGSFRSGAEIQLAPVLSTSGATTYRWKKDNVNLFNSGAYSGVTTPTLTIHANDPSQSGSYTLAITNPCGVTTTAPAVVGVSCAADWNGDGGVDGDDVIAFMFLWDSGDAGADFNADGGVDGDDVIGFFGRWDSGC